ncbi:Uncharacterized protein TCM_004283 [Theobroma cacao]|uniref:Uncharacterized protein n=1 Tax=Theobroma cacao TaxID=3641 RepID=A0A061DPG5_THECC|nr:Uncharacterized protein TCM_004283 [Theobroma cacao]
MGGGGVESRDGQQNRGTDYKVEGPKTHDLEGFDPPSAATCQTTHVSSTPRNQKRGPRCMLKTSFEPPRQLGLALGATGLAEVVSLAPLIRF